MSAKSKPIPVADAAKTAHEVVQSLRDVCIKIGCDLPKQGKVDQIEIRYSPAIQFRLTGIFGRTPIDLAQERVDWLVRTKWFENNGTLTRNGLAVVLRKEMPV